MNLHAAIASANISRSEGEILLAFLLQCDRSNILAHPDRELPSDILVRFQEMLLRRATGEPISYIIGEREFYGRPFLVDRRVHIPRPSTENLVTMALDFLRNPKDEVRELESGIIGVAKVLRDCANIHTVVDVGTGSGCIAITLALERPDVHVIAIDISTDALAVAKENAQRLGAPRIEFLEGDVLSPVEHLQQSFIVVGNPPYVSDDGMLANPDLHHEPRIALCGGAKCNTVIQRIDRDAALMAHCKGTIMEQML